MTKFTSQFFLLTNMLNKGSILLIALFYFMIHSTLLPKHIYTRTYELFPDCCWITQWCNTTCSTASYFLSSLTLHLHLFNYYNFLLLTFQAKRQLYYIITYAVKNERTDHQHTARSNSGITQILGKNTFIIVKLHKYKPILSYSTSQVNLPVSLKDSSETHD